MPPKKLVTSKAQYMCTACHRWIPKNLQDTHNLTYHSQGNFNTITIVGSKVKENIAEEEPPQLIPAPPLQQQVPIQQQQPVQVEQSNDVRGYENAPAEEEQDDSDTFIQGVKGCCGSLGRFIMSVANFIIWLFTTIIAVAQASITVGIAFFIILIFIYVYTRYVVVAEWFSRVWDSIKGYVTDFKDESIHFFRGNNTQTIFERQVKDLEPQNIPDTIRQHFAAFKYKMGDLAGALETPGGQPMTQWVKEQIDPLIEKVTNRVQNLSEKAVSVNDAHYLTNYLLQLDSAIDYCAKEVFARFDDRRILTVDELGNVIQTCGLARL